MFSKTILYRAAGLGLAATLAACGGSDNSSGQGTIRFALTDAPACGFDAVNVTVERVRVHGSSSAADNDGGWSEVLVSPARRVNLLDLTNGVLEELGGTPVPAGTYQQVRLVLAENSGANPLANSVVPTGGSEVPLDTPSSQQSGLKLQAHMEVPEGKVADFVLDFDACKSIVPRGNSGRYNLKPVISVLPRLMDAGLRVEGYVASALGTSGTSVSLQQAGLVARATVPDAAGKFVLSPVPAGTYDLVVNAQGRVIAVMTGVPVTTGAVTTTNRSTEPIDPVATTTRSVSGTVTTTGSSTIPDATVRVLQSLSGGPNIEVADGFVDPTTGAYAYSVPAGAPVKTAYAAGATSLTFSADTTVAGKYTVEASVPGKPAQTAIIDVAGGDVSLTPFAFMP